MQTHQNPSGHQTADGANSLNPSQHYSIEKVTKCNEGTLFAQSVGIKA